MVKILKIKNKIIMKTIKVEKNYYQHPDIYFVCAAGSLGDNNFNVYDKRTGALLHKYRDSKRINVK